YWLEPLPDRSLPNITIIEQMFKVLNKLPITTEHLLSSKVGRIVFFYQDSPRSDERIKRLASELVRKWTRKIYNISTNYKDKNFKRVEFHPETMAEAHATAASNNAISEDRSHQTASSSTRARIPQAASFDYDVMPEVRIIQNRKRADDPYKHIKQTMARMRRQQK
ncbi:3457_t:CDS:2, partial [Acaulospora morrowiae]